MKALIHWRVNQGVRIGILSLALTHCGAWRDIKATEAATTGSMEARNAPDAREDIDGAIRLYISLLEKKDAVKFLETALHPEVQEEYRRANQYENAIRTLNGPFRENAISVMQELLEKKLKPTVSRVEYLKKDIARYEWTSPVHGKVRLSLMRKGGRWYLNW